MMSEDHPVTQLWTQLNAVNDHARTLDLDQETIAYSFIE